jgi:hypothetical protein
VAVFILGVATGRYAVLEVGAMTHPANEVVYQLNERDEITYVNEGWCSFARANNAADLSPENVLHRPLWGYVSDLTTLQLYRDLLASDSLRSTELLRSCGWCKRVDVGGGEWAEVEEAVVRLRLFDLPKLPLLTHGMCEGCQARMLAMLVSD